MKSRALRVVRERGEETRRRLREREELRPDLEIAEDAGWIFLPITDDALVTEDEGTVVDRDFERANPRGPEDYRDLLAHWSAGERATLPRSYDVVGDIVLVRLPPVLVPRGREVGEALLRFVPGARLVGADHGVHGPERRREVERIAGSGPWRTRHRENGIEFDVDVERAYFSPRLAREHARVAGEVEPGQRVYDLCCGVGPFALTIAHLGQPSSVVAVDSNPVAIELLRATSSRYGLDGLVRAETVPVEQFLDGRTPADRVVLNLPHEGIKYLVSVGNVVSTGGRLFYYEVTERDVAAGRPDELAGLLGPSWRAVDSRVVHPYSPASDLMGFTLERGAA